MTHLDAAWTDVVLALACAGGAWLGRSRGWVPVLGFGTVGVAAAVGSLRFAGFASLEPLHDGLSALGGMVGIPLLAVASIARLLERQATAIAVGIAVLGSLLVVGLGPEGVRPLRTALTGSVLLGLLLVSAWKRHPAGAAAALAVLVAGLGVAGEGSWLGIDRIGWFHLVMAGAMGLFARVSTSD